MSTSALRMRELRRRRRKGFAQFKIEVDEHRLAEALIASQRLIPEETLHRNLVERQLGLLIEDFIEAFLGP